MDMVVLVLKNLRSQWFGQTDVIFDDLTRSGSPFKVLIFVDEADHSSAPLAQAHETERRLTGKIKATDVRPTSQGQGILAADRTRIHRLSPDLRRPAAWEISSSPCSIRRTKIARPF